MPPLPDNSQPPEAAFWPAPADLRSCSTAELQQLAQQIRELIIETVAQTGGHLASNLGVVELTLALLCEYDFPTDQLVFDVGHQCYAWKILTGRRQQFGTLRQKDGLSGFPKSSESPYDCFNTGHSSTAISAATGLARAARLQNKARAVVALVGDGALTGGLSFEALNDAGQAGEDLLVIVNDNRMSISRNVGGLAHHLERLRLSRRYRRLKSFWERTLEKLPLLGKPLVKLMSKVKGLDRVWLRPSGVLFEQLGFRYYGPVDGHDLEDLRHYLRKVKQIKGPVVLHVMTTKGLGFAYSEERPDQYHGVAPFALDAGIQPQAATHRPGYSQLMGDWLLAAAETDLRLVAITAAMASGTGLSAFQTHFPERFFDVGIAEQHALTLAAGMAAGGLRPYVALYSTFLQRGLDQLIHDICLQQLPVCLLIDRAGLVGEDGETHQGLYDLAYLLPLPNLTIYAPDTDQGLVQALAASRTADGPVAIRYPKAAASVSQTDGATTDSVSPAGTTHWHTGTDLTFLAVGALLPEALQAVQQLAKEHIFVDLYSANCLKPFNFNGMMESVQQTGKLLIVEDGILHGGFGQSTRETWQAQCPGLEVTCAGVADPLAGQATRAERLADEGLDAVGMIRRIRQMLTD